MQGGNLAQGAQQMHKSSAPKAGDLGAPDVLGATCSGGIWAMPFGQHTVGIYGTF